MTTPRPTTSVSTQLELRLVAASGERLPVEAVLRYETGDPYAVRIDFHTGGDEVVQWTFARQLLTDGMSRAAGEGDVTVQPVPATAGRPDDHLVSLALSSPSGTALFEAPLGRVVEYLAETYVAVPSGCEGDFVDLDAELALLIWSGAGE